VTLRVPPETAIQFYPSIVETGVDAPGIALVDLEAGVR
jgi:hypothetical protein